MDCGSGGDGALLAAYDRRRGTATLEFQIMRLAALMSAAAVLAFTGAAHAQTVSVAIGPKLQDKAEKYGQRELDFLARDLQESVARRVGAVPGRYELIIVDARPNRPTFEQLGDRIGLSPLSYGVGGAAVEGAYVAPDGTRTPIRYRWYESDITWARHASTWADAETAFNRLGNRLARGQLYAAR
jgi:hypothetical protein